MGSALHRPCLLCKPLPARRGRPARAATGPFGASTEPTRAATGSVGASTPPPPLFRCGECAGQERFRGDFARKDEPSPALDAAREYF